MAKTNSGVAPQTQAGPVRTIAVAFSAYPNHALIFGLALLIFGGSATSAAVLLLTRSDTAGHTGAIIWALVIMVVSFLMAAVIVALLSAKGAKGGFRELVNDKEINPLLVTIREGIERAISVNHKVFRRRIYDDLVGIAAFVANWRNCELHLTGPNYYETLKWLYENATGEIRIITTPANLAQWQRPTGASQSGKPFSEVIDRLANARQGITLKKIIFCESVSSRPLKIVDWLKAQRDLGFEPGLYIDDEDLTQPDSKAFDQIYHVFDGGDVVVKESVSAANVLSGVMFFMNPEKQKQANILWKKVWDNRDKSFDATKIEQPHPSDDGNNGGPKPPAQPVSPLELQMNRDVLQQIKTQRATDQPQDNSKEAEDKSLAEQQSE